MPVFFPCKFIVYELFLYLLSTVIKKRSYHWAAFFIEHRYVVASTLGGSRFDEHDISVFNEHIRALENYRKQERKLNRLSITADVMKARATNSVVRFQDILQTDFLLFIREFFPNADGPTNWYPRCAVFLGNTETFELFARAASKTGIGALQTILRVKNVVDLAIYLNRMIGNSHFQRIMQSERMWMAGAEPSRLLNVQRLTELAEKADS